MAEFRREIDLLPAFDRRHPDPSENYGIHGVELRFTLKGEKGAVHFLVYTDWMLPHVQEELHRKYGAADGLRPWSKSMLQPTGADVGYHSLVPRYDGQERPQEECEYLDDRPCYYDGSGLRAAEWVRDILLPKGSDGIWAALEDEYHVLFDSEDKTMSEYFCIHNRNLTEFCADCANEYGHTQRELEEEE